MSNFSSSSLSFSYNFLCSSLRICNLCLSVLKCFLSIRNNVRIVRIQICLCFSNRISKIRLNLCYLCLSLSLNLRNFSSSICLRSNSNTGEQIA